MAYHVIYDGNCHLCVTLVQWLEQWDQGQRFCYVPMQDQSTLAEFGITPAECELGMILVESSQPEQRWQGSAAAEEIGRLLPLGAGFVEVYRRLPGLKWLGDHGYDRIRDNRYAWFGQRDRTYTSAYAACHAGNCSLEGKSSEGKVLG